MSLINGKGIRINTVSVISTVIIMCSSILIFYVVSFMERDYDNIEMAMDERNICEEAARAMEDASDCLTDRVRMFVLTGDVVYARDYFVESEMTKRREKAIEDINASSTDQELKVELNQAFKDSLALMQLEYHAMKLVCEANGIDAADISPELSKVKLSKNEEALSLDDKQRMAVAMVSGPEYADQKMRINSEIRDVIQRNMDVIRAKEETNAQAFLQSYYYMKLVLVAMIAFGITSCIIFRRIIVEPLIGYRSSIKAGRLLTIQGAHELRRLAEIYNKVFLRNIESQRLLIYKAEHDALTGLYNRGTFTRRLKEFEEGTSKFALAMIDGDKFKHINDTYGHDVGDRILKKISNTLLHAFRSEDEVFRLGGDEFAVILTNVDISLKDVIENKLNKINSSLQNTEDDLPPIGISCGVAFSEKLMEGDVGIYVSADTALYEAKEGGRARVAFYGL